MASNRSVPLLNLPQGHRPSIAPFLFPSVGKLPFQPATPSRLSAYHQSHQHHAQRTALQSLGLHTPSRTLQIPAISHWLAHSQHLVQGRAASPQPLYQLQYAQVSEIKMSDVDLSTRSACSASQFAIRKTINIGKRVTIRTTQGVIDHLPPPSECVDGPELQRLGY
ncbi:hypothetical protein BU16DRAFT_622743 [Lophium mytilinum]|uniref:Uncharacterized protein n=1 Tax=Lophium mytilinum TaxID=390894 RepID=A0A6A6QAJ3_9PEZI|nr:hypothetical protein BU16DRAFT_622743 [Lophium mytilinum]